MTAHKASIRVARSQRMIAELGHADILDALAHAEEMRTALRVIHTWAGVPGALDARHVRELTAKALHMPPNVELSGARRASDSNAGLDDAVRYWLCCGSKVYPHGAESCYEARAGHPERVRWGTAKEHSEWQKKKSSNAELRGRPLADGPA